MQSSVAYGAHAVIKGQDRTDKNRDLIRKWRNHVHEDLRREQFNGYQCLGASLALIGPNGLGGKKQETASELSVEARAALQPFTVVFPCLCSEDGKGSLDNPKLPRRYAAPLNESNGHARLAFNLAGRERKYRGRWQSRAAGCLAMAGDLAGQSALVGVAPHPNMPLKRRL
jgi:hypothetical protein